jgi:hypothetical protein
VIFYNFHTTYWLDMFAGMVHVAATNWHVGGIVWLLTERLWAPYLSQIPLCLLDARNVQWEKFCRYVRLIFVSSVHFNTPAAPRLVDFSTRQHHKSGPSSVPRKLSVVQYFRYCLCTDCFFHSSFVSFPEFSSLSCWVSSEDVFFCCYVCAVCT